MPSPKLLHACGMVAANGFLQSQRGAGVGKQACVAKRGAEPPPSSSYGRLRSNVIPELERTQKGGRRQQGLQ